MTSETPAEDDDTPRNDGVVFVTFCGCEFAFLGTHQVGVVRDRGAGAEWLSYLARDGRSTWRPAASLDQARDGLRRHVRDWYDALHTPLEPGQGERLAAQAVR